MNVWVVAASVLVPWSWWRMLSNRDHRTLAFVVFRGLRPRHFLAGAVGIVAVLVVGAALLQVPLLDYGWIRLVRLVTGNEHGQASIPVPTSFTWRYFWGAIVLAAMPWIPRWAEHEEREFRLGSEDLSWPRRLRRSLRFGMVHAWNGIPLAFCLALSLGGLWFTVAYLAGVRAYTKDPLPAPAPAYMPQAIGLFESTLAHTAWNIQAFTLIGLVLTGTLA